MLLVLCVLSHHQVQYLSYQCLSQPSAGVPTRMQYIALHCIAMRQSKLERHCIAFNGITRIALLQAAADHWLCTCAATSLQLPP
jgi:hypothetical protein